LSEAQKKHDSVNLASLLGKKMAFDIQAKVSKGNEETKERSIV
jgi:hypothetical protein